MSLATLPAELYAAILSHISEDLQSSTVLALTRAIPRSSVPVDKLFESIRLTSQERILQLQRRLHTRSLTSIQNTSVHTDARFIRQLRLESWTVDPNVVNNFLAFLHGPQIQIESLTLWIGPHFGPDILEEILQKPRTALQSLEIRFRPYLQRANYYTFLAGIYFDSSLLALARWPSSSLSSLSIIQDPFDHATQPSGIRRDNFAQPIVFFNLTPLSALATSRALIDVRSLRLRIPSRDVTPFLSASSSAFPSLEILDLSSCNVNDSDLERLLMRFSRVKHIVLDRCALMRPLRIPGGQVDGQREWYALGRLCALVGSKVAKEREKELKAWIEAHDAAHQRQEMDDNNAVIGQVAQRRRARAGRKGLATATISLRQVDDAASNTPNVLELTEDKLPPQLEPLLSQKLRILPIAPSLQNVCTSYSFTPSDSSRPSRIDPSEAARIQTEFAEGWAEGINQLRIKWRRLRTFQSGSSKVRVMCFSKGRTCAGPDGTALDERDPLRGLIDIGDNGTFSWEQLEETDWAPPSICLADMVWKEEDATFHAFGCGHLVSADVWDKYKGNIPPNQC